MNKRILLIVAAVVFFSVSGNAQVKDPRPTRIGPATSVAQSRLELKLALKGSEPFKKDGKQFHKIVLTITNRDRLNVNMFVNDPPVQLPPSPCHELRLPVEISIFTEDNQPLLTCQGARTVAELDRFSFLIEKGKPMPEFVFATVTNRKSGEIYRSNLLSPKTGHTK